MAISKQEMRRRIRGRVQRQKMFTYMNPGIGTFRISKRATEAMQAALEKAGFKEAGDFMDIQREVALNASKAVEQIEAAGLDPAQQEITFPDFSLHVAKDDQVVAIDTEEFFPY